MIQLTITEEQFLYLRRAVGRDCEDYETLLECGVDEDGFRHELDCGEAMAEVLGRVFQEQVVPF